MSTMPLYEILSTNSLQSPKGKKARVTAFEQRNESNIGSRYVLPVAALDQLAASCKQQQHQYSVQVHDFKLQEGL